SGKSLTMVFLVRKMRTMPSLRRFKVVVVTDRTDLQKQLAATAELTGDVVKVGKKIAQVKSLLAERGPGLVFAMIQKYADADPDELDAGVDEDGIDERTVANADFPVLNEDEAVLVMVDEAHRSHTSGLHANLMTALPNCARIGFTGTPIIMGARKRTHEIFGEYIDRYTIRQSEEDGATVPIVYEGRTAEGAVKDGHDLDTLFEDMWPDWSAADLERVKNRYATKNDVLEASELIDAKAKDMLEHYVEHILPNGFKAQIVAVSRRATLRYYDGLHKARTALVAELEALDPVTAALDDEAAESLPRRDAFLRRASRHLATIRELEFAPVISGNKQKDDPSWQPWTDRAKIDARIESFKKPLHHDDPSKRSPLAFLIVKSMLLTGFDAPIEQAMYLDRHIKEAELLQAVARVNRTHGEKKRVGIVVDYYGVARHLKEALAVYAKQDVEGALHSLADELPKLRDQHLRLKAMFADRGLEVVGTLTRRERDHLASRFRRWQHPLVTDASKAAVLGDGSMMAAHKVVRVLESVAMAPTPGLNDDPYVRLHQKLVSAVRDLLSDTTSPTRRDNAIEQMSSVVEPTFYKVLSHTEPDAFHELRNKRSSLTAAITKLMDLGRSRYRLKLSSKQFEQIEGWEDRTSYENAVRDTVPARNRAAHDAAAVEPNQWLSSAAMILGLVDENLADLEHLPAPDSKEATSDAEALQLLRDDNLRAQLHVELKRFLSTLDTVLPRPEGKPYLRDARHLSALYERARRRYRGAERPLGQEVGEKVRTLIDDHVISLGLDPKIPPINILDAEFEEHIGRHRSDRAKASEMEHAARHHIRQHLDEDPEHYLKLSERLDAILQELDGRWDELVDALRPFVSELRAGRQPDETGLDPVIEAPFFGVIKLAISPTEELPDDTKEKVRVLTVDLVAHVRQEIAIVEFWQKASAVKQLRTHVFTELDDANLLPFDELDYVADKILELAKSNHGKLVS
ncbi:MAG: DEAD/DEAH box helicase family protein, partial [Nannocystaceae bacterium]